MEPISSIKIKPGGSIEILTTKALMARCKFRLFRLRVAQPIFWLACLVAGTTLFPDGDSK